MNRFQLNNPQSIQLYRAGACKCGYRVECGSKSTGIFFVKYAGRSLFDEPTFGDQPTNFVIRALETGKSRVHNRSRGTLNKVNRTMCERKQTT